MEELFGLDMDVLMAALLGVFLVGLGIVGAMALRNRVMLRLGVRPIGRRPGQTALIIVGVMLSTIIISASFGTGDTLSFTIRNEAITSLRAIDEVIVPTRAGDDATFASSYMPIDRFDRLRSDLADDANIDGLAPQLAELMPAVNVRTSLSEGRMRLAGLDPGLLGGFGTISFVSGKAASLDDLAEGEVYINDEAVKELDARPGDRLRTFAGDREMLLTVAGVVESGGLAGRDPTVLMALDQAQRLFDREGQINSIIVSNRGDEISGADLSEEVTKDLRVRFTDREIALELKDLLDDEPVLAGLRKKGEDLQDVEIEELNKLIAELERPDLTDELISMLADDGPAGLILDTLESEELKDLERRAATLFEDLAELRVIDLKRRALSEADHVGSEVTSFFLLFSLFSITVGILLIFLIFVMLAAARRSEMGMTRAVGAKRRHLVQMFVFEGTAYALVAAAVGVAIGLGVSAIMVALINRIISGLGEEFLIVRHYEVRSVVVSYCLGMVITFATVAISAYRVSHLNIVLAVRGLPDSLVPKQEPTLRTRLAHLPRAMFRPLIFLFRGLTAVRRRRFDSLFGYIALAAVWALPPLWVGGIAVALFRFAWPYLLRGWLTFLLGTLLVFANVTVWERVSWFGAGVSLMVIGLGLMLRSVLARTALRSNVRDRIAFTAMGLTVLAFWSLPMDFFEAVTGELEGDFDVMFVSGIAMVAAAVWTIMYNADLLLGALTFATGRIGRLRPVLVTAVAYPMSSKFRTGLTLAMFALVIFTLMVMSVLTATFNTQFDDADTITGGWDIEGKVNANTPIEDISIAIAEHPDLDRSWYAAIGGFTRIGARARMADGGSQRWHGVAVRAADAGFMTNTDYEMKLIAEGYGPTGEDVWAALRDDPGLAIIGGRMVPAKASPGNEDSDEHLFGDLYYDDETMSPVEVELREPRTGATVNVTVIGVIDRVHENSGWMFVSAAMVEDALPFPLPITTYRFKVVDGQDQKGVSRRLEAAFIQHGMNTEVMEDELAEQAAAGKAFSYIFIGFMSLGLLVGVAALGVVSTRAVVERRQQIGVLRAIGYRRRMVQLSFLLESSFISVLGMAIGMVLGIILSYNAVNDIKSEAAGELDTLRLTIPWLQIALILGGTYVFSLVTTFLPSRQASRTYPAEALRYE